MKNLLIIISFLMLLSSCHTNKDKEQGKQRIQDSLEERNNAIADSITAKYQIKYFLDTLDTDDFFTIDFRPILQTKFQLIKDFEIVDIAEKDTQLLMTIKKNYRDVYFNLSLDTNQYNTLRQLNLNNDDFLFVIKLHNAYKVKLKIDTECESENEDGSCNEPNFVIVQPRFSSYFGNGKLVDIIKLEN